VHDDGRVEVLNVTRDTTMATSARVARSFWARGRGLMFARELPQGAGLVIDPCGSIHMFFMRFALDVVYVDRDDRVVRAQRGIRPWRVGPLRTKGARYVVELPVGSIESTGTQVGDQLRIEGRQADVPSVASLP
jgi:uncharacterized membrane protein (UPF0127 family)